MDYTLPNDLENDEVPGWGLNEAERACADFYVLD